MTMAGQLVQHYLDESLAPDNKVVCCNGQKSITYGQLKKESNRLRSEERRVGKEC